jgi:hypothetical protein
MTVTGVKIALGNFPTIQDCRLHVDGKVDKSKSFLVLHDLAVHGKYLLPLIERWLNEFPGRVFIDKAPVTQDKANYDDIELLNEEHIIRKRLPEFKADLCWSGALLVDTTRSTKIHIMNPVKPDRLPQTEFLFVLAQVSESHWESIPSSTNRALHCVVEAEAGSPSLNHCVIIAPSRDGDCSLYMMTEAPVAARGKPKRPLTANQKEYLLRPIPSPSLFNEMYKSTITDVARHSPQFLRSLAVGLRKLHKDQADIITTRKHLNVYRTLEKIEESIFPFFATLGPPSEKSTEYAGNFENTAVVKRMNAKKRITQEGINKIFEKLSTDAGSVEDHVYEKKRFRRLFGTSYNSHKWEHPAVSQQSVDGPLASEVIGSL